MLGGGFNIMELYAKGDWVIWPIAALSVVSLTITVERAIVLIIQNFKLKPERFASVFDELLKRNNGDRMRAVDEMLPFVRKKGGVCGAIAEEVLVKYKDGVSKGLGPVDLRQWMTQAAESKAIVQIPELEAHLGALAVISNVATLMGLFGTVYGMIQSFFQMSKSVGGVKADEMAGGIAVALIATLTGLVVAIPSLVLYNYMKSLIEGFVVQLEEATSSVVDKLVS
jgi:biopolymer transport protein ExbB